MAKIKATFIDDLREKSINSHEKIISHYLGAGKKSGSQYTWLCPFHKDTSPSFSLSPSKGLATCFSCKAFSNSGLDFVIKHLNLENEFYEAVKITANFLGMTVEYEESDSNEKEVHEERVKLLKALNDAANGYSRDVIKNEAVSTYLHSERGLTQKTIQDFGMGYTMGGFVSKVLINRHSASVLESAGLLCRPKEGVGSGQSYDFFRKRLMIPIHSDKGAVIGFTARTLEKGGLPKYINSPDTPVFSKGSVLFNLHRAIESIRKSGMSVVVEGAMDTAGLAQAGEERAVAPLGCALTETHVRKLLRHGREIAFCFDNDKAGKAAMKRSIETFLSISTDDHIASFINLIDSYKDPDEMVKSLGIEAWNQCVEKRASLSTTIAKICIAEAEPEGIKTVEGKIKSAIYASELIALIKNAPLRQRALAEFLQQSLGLPIGPAPALTGLSNKSVVGLPPTPAPKPVAAISAQPKPTQARRGDSCSPAKAVENLSAQQVQAPQLTQRLMKEASSVLGNQTVLEVLPLAGNERPIHPQLVACVGKIQDAIQGIERSGVCMPLIVLPLVNRAHTGAYKMVVLANIGGQLYVSPRNEDKLESLIIDLHPVTKFQSDAVVTNLNVALMDGEKILRQHAASLIENGYITPASVARKLLHRAAQGQPSEFAIWAVSQIKAPVILTGSCKGTPTYHLRPSRIEPLSQELISKLSNNGSPAFVHNYQTGETDKVKYYVRDQVNDDRLLVGEIEANNISKSLNLEPKTNLEMAPAL
ncbi:DNA primase [Iodobacter sp. CM08]|uniref:DNA primase n=1 Tax=Iodobacter sp. CM08 TaxID=3085902 RepID=UPI00298246C0|nr:DNA primase [Iodobacter sp. CM08]MDW5418639.1 DNA primase [Iodobacter sp. CM08]